MSTRRERRIIEAQNRETEASRAKRRFRIRVASLCAGTTALAGAIAALVTHPPAFMGAVGRNPASVAGVPPEVVEKAKDGEKKKTLEEVKAELDAKESKAKKTKEWVWAEQGHTELVIAAYRKEQGRGSSAREERARLLNILGRTARPRAEWPRAFNDEKARAVMDLFAEILRGDHAPGPEPITAAQNIAAFAKANAEFRGRADEELQAYYASDTRMGPRGDTLMALAEVQSKEGLLLAAKAAQVSDGELARSGVYSLGTYLEQPALERDAVKALRETAKTRTDLRPLAIKLLANHGSREIASLVPGVLRKGATPQEVEAGAFAVNHLRLKEYRPLLVERLSDSENPFLSQEIDAAIKELDQK